MRHPILLSLALVTLATIPPRAAEPASQPVEQMVIALSSGTPEQRQEARLALELLAAHASRPDARGERERLERTLCSHLAPPTPIPARAWIAQILAWFGGPDSVAPLASLLREYDPEIRDPARRALETNPSPAATAALREALARASTSLERLGLLQSLAARRDAPSHAQISGALADPDPDVALAATQALAKIGDAHCVLALDRARPKANPTLRAAIERALAIADATPPQTLEQLARDAGSSATRTAALTRLAPLLPETAAAIALEQLHAPHLHTRLVALRFALTSPIPGLREKGIAQIPHAPSPLQIAAARLLGELADPRTAPALLALADSQDPEVRAAALAALGTVGDATHVALLLDRFTRGTPQERDAAERSLTLLRDDAIDATLLASSESGDPSRRAAALVALAARNAPGARAACMRAALAADPALRDPALDALRMVAGKEELAPLAALVATLDDGTTRRRTQTTLRAAIERAATPDAAWNALAAALDLATSDAARADLLAILPAAPVPPALQLLARTAADRAAPTREAAARALADWPTLEAAPHLVTLADAPESELKIYVLAQRGLARLISSEQTGTPEQRLALAERALAATRRADERRLLAAALGNSKIRAAIPALERLRKDPEIAREAELAIGKLRR